MPYLPLPRSVMPAVFVVSLLLVDWLRWASLRHPEDLWAPGHLSRYHTDIAKCSTCHTPFLGPTTSKCVTCHTAEVFAARSQPAIGLFHETAVQEGRPCLECHTEHRGALAQITIGAMTNPHGEFVFLATGTHSCTECHAFEAGMGSLPTLLDNSVVQDLLEEGDGRHQPGRFARCLKCHVGGEVEIDDD